MMRYKVKDKLDSRISADPELENLKGQYYNIEMRFSELIRELIIELDKQGSIDALRCQVKEDIKNLTNKVFDKESVD